MPRDLFGDVTRPSISLGNRKWYTVPVSLLSHFAIVIAIILVPLLAPAWMPSPWQGRIGAVVMDLVPPTPPPPPSRVRRDQPAVDPRLAPVTAPETIAPEKPLDLDWQESTAPGIIGGTDNIEQVIAPPPVMPQAPPTAPLHVGGAVRPPVRTRHADPVYSPIALAARIQGIVIIEATIGADGRVINARILRSVPLLDQSALDAVRQWEYTPTMLNGVPVPVIMTVTVQFTLSR